jgi:hypothetical protein
LLLAPLAAAAQDLESRRWTHLPTGTNNIAIGYAGQEADIYFNPLIGISDGTAEINAWLGRYSRAFDWSGKTARLDVMLPCVSGTWQGLVDGQPASRAIRSGGDPGLRLSMNFFGAPALRGQGGPGRQPDTIRSRQRAMEPDGQLPHHQPSQRHCGLATGPYPGQRRFGYRQLVAVLGIRLGALNNAYR